MRLAHRLLGLGHGQCLLTRDLHLGMHLSHVLLDVGDDPVMIARPKGDATLAMDNLGHVEPPYLALRFFRRVVCTACARVYDRAIGASLGRVWGKFGSMPLRVYLAGRVAIESGDVVLGVRDFPGTQGRLAFAYLAARTGSA